MYKFSRLIKLYLIIFIVGLVLLYIYKVFIDPSTVGGFQNLAPFWFYIFFGIPFVLVLSFFTGVFILLKEFFLESKPLNHTLLIIVFIFLWLSIISISYYSKYLSF